MILKTSPNLSGFVMSLHPQTFLPMRLFLLHYGQVVFDQDPHYQKADYVDAQRAEVERHREWLKNAPEEELIKDPIYSSSISNRSLIICWNIKG